LILVHVECFEEEIKALFGLLIVNWRIKWLVGNRLDDVRLL